MIRQTSIYVGGQTTRARTPAEDEYDTRYATAFHRAAAAPPERKLTELLGHATKLPGVEAPTGSTIIHFIHPETMPIIDVRTVETLLEAHRISTKTRDLEHYEEYRNAIDIIRLDYPDLTLRQIDRALFSYHKQVLDRKPQHRADQCQT